MIVHFDELLLVVALGCAVFVAHRGERRRAPGARVPPGFTDAQLQAELGRRRATVASYVFDCFLAPLRLIDVQDGVAVVDAGTKVGADWIGDNEDTRAALVGAAGGPVRLVARA